MNIIYYSNLSTQVGGIRFLRTTVLPHTHMHAQRQTDRQTDGQTDRHRCTNYKHTHKTIHYVSNFKRHVRVHHTIKRSLCFDIISNTIIINAYASNTNRSTNTIQLNTKSEVGCVMEEEDYIHLIYLLITICGKTMC